MSCTTTISDLPEPLLGSIFTQLIDNPDCSAIFCRLSCVCKTWRQVLLPDEYWQSIRVPAALATHFTDRDLQTLAARCQNRPHKLDLTACTRLSTFVVMTLLLTNNSPLYEVKLIDCSQIAIHNYEFYLQSLLARPVVHLKRLYITCTERVHHRPVWQTIVADAKSAQIDFRVEFVFPISEQKKL